MGDVPRSPPYGVYISQLIRFARVCSNCGRPWPDAYINFNQNTHQIQVLTKPLCRAQAIFYCRTTSGVPNIVG